MGGDGCRTSLPSPRRQRPQHAVPHSGQRSWPARKEACGSHMYGATAPLVNAARRTGADKGLLGMGAGWARMDAKNGWERMQDGCEMPRDADGLGRIRGR